MNGVVLLIEDNKELNEINCRKLEKEGYDVYAALTIQTAREKLAGISPDVILLDIMLPDGNGFDFCKEIRSTTDAHILFLTSRREQEDKIRGLILGGDDYLTKPFHLDELISKVASVMRRRKMSKAPPKTIEIGNLTLDMIAMIALVNATDILLPKMEFSLLLLFAQNEGKVLSVENIYETTWKMPMMGDKQTVQKRISGLRKKLVDAECSHTINSVYGKGYCFEKF
jgi:DNA-binding response OmpR family regulator